MYVDAVPAEGETVLGHGFAEPLDGGKATSQAIVAARLGAPVRFVTVLGADERGRRWWQILADENIDLSWVIPTDQPMDVGFVMLPPNGIPAIATSLGANQKLNAEAVQRVAPAIETAGVVVCQLEAPQDAALAAFRIARTHGVPTILNPAPAVALDAELIELTDVLIPNEHEAATLVGVEGGADVLARWLGEQHPHLTVIVTAGADGAYGWTGGGPLFHVPAPRVEPVDTTGAGDAFVGAVATCVRTGVDMSSAVSFAVRVASLSTTRQGTIPSLPTRQEIGAP